MAGFNETHSAGILPS